MELRETEGKFTGVKTQYTELTYEIKTEVPYVNDEVHGIVKEWFKKDGMCVSVEIPYIAGKRHGVAKTYDELGRLVQEDTYEDDKLSGETIRYNTDGTIKVKTIYDNGYPVYTVDVNSNRIISIKG